MSANVVFINIDWKASRHLKTLNTNMKRLGKTIANVVNNTTPTMICMCEVGEATIPLTEEQMQQVSNQSMRAWKEAATEHFKGAATEHFELRSMFQVGAPYIRRFTKMAQSSAHAIAFSRISTLQGIYHVRRKPFYAVALGRARWELSLVP